MMFRFATILHFLEFNVQDFVQGRRSSLRSKNSGQFVISPAVHWKYIINMRATFESPERLPTKYKGISSGSSS